MSAARTAGASPPTSLHIDTARTWRGGQGQALYTVKGLRSLGRSVTLVAHPDGELRRRMSGGPDLIPLAPRHEVDITAAWRLARLIRTRQPDIVHAHDPHAVAMATMALTMVTQRPRLVASRRIEFRIGHNPLSRWKYGQVDGFIAISRAVESRLVADGISPERIAVVHEGVDVERIVGLPAGSLRAELQVPDGTLVVGNVGALVEQKGQHDLVEAAALVVRDVPDVRFVILGEGELRHALEARIAQHHLEQHVVLAGFRSEVLEWTKAFDLFVVSSHQEGMCTALVDAMAAARPSVGTRVGGVPEVIADGETGFLVPVGDHAAMATQIVRLLKDPGLRDRMGAAALARARARFTVDATVAGTERVYERLLAGQPVASVRPADPIG